MENFNETQLLNYLNKEVTNTKGFIKRASNELNRIVESDDMTIEMHNKGQNLLNDIQSYRFRLMWLQSQINEVSKLVQI